MTDSTDLTPTPMPPVELRDSGGGRHTGVGRDAGLGVAGRIIAMMCSSVTAVLIAATLSPTDYGRYAVVVGINVVLVMALDLGMTSSISRFIAQGRASSRLVRHTAILRFVIMAATAGLVLIAHQIPAVRATEVGGRLLPMLALLIIAQSMISFHFGVLPSLRRVPLLFAVTVAQPIGELCLVLFVRSRGGGAPEMLMATAISALIVSTIAWFFVRADSAEPMQPANRPESAAHTHLNDVLHYGRRIFLVTVLIALFGQIDQFIIDLFHPSAEVAPYAIALKFQALVAAVATTIAGVVAPRIAGAGSGSLAMYRKWLSFIVVLDLGAVLTLGVLAPQFFDAISPEYADDWGVLLAMLPFLLLLSCAPLPSITLNQTGHAGSRLNIALVTVAINGTLDFALIPWMGAYGAAISTAIAFIYYFVHHHRLVERVLRDEHGGTAPAIWGVVGRGSLVAVGVALLAAAVRWLLNAMVDGNAQSAEVVIVAGLIAAVVHTMWSVRIVRGGHPVDADIA